MKEILLLMHDDLYQVIHCKKCVRKFLIYTVFMTVVLPTLFFLEMHYKLSIFSYWVADAALIPEKLLSNVHAAVVYAVFQYAFPYSSHVLFK